MSAAPASMRTTPNPIRGVTPEGRGPPPRSQCFTVMK